MVEHIIEGVRDYMKTCPCITNLQRLLVDNLTPQNNAFSIEEVPTNTVVETNIDGSTTEQFVFVFAGRLRYSDEIAVNISNSGIFEDIQQWLEEQTEIGNLPQLPRGLTATEIKAMSSGYVMGVAGDMASARYQIQCRLLYERG